MERESSADRYNKNSPIVAAQSQNNDAYSANRRQEFNNQSVN